MADNLKKTKAAPRKAATKAVEPWKDYEVEMLLVSYRIHCYSSRSSCSLLSNRHKNSKKAGFIYCRLRYGLKRMRTSLCSFISLALSVPVSKKTKCKRSLFVPRFSEDRAIFLSVPLQNVRA